MLDFLAFYVISFLARLIVILSYRRIIKDCIVECLQIIGFTLNLSQTICAHLLPCLIHEQWFTLFTANTKVWTPSYRLLLRKKTNDIYFSNDYFSFAPTFICALHTLTLSHYWNLKNFLLLFLSLKPVTYFVPTNKQVISEELNSLESVVLVAYSFPRLFFTCLPYLTFRSSSLSSSFSHVKNHLPLTSLSGIFPLLAITVICNIRHSELGLYLT